MMDSIIIKRKYSIIVLFALLLCKFSGAQNKRFIPLTHKTIVQSVEDIKRL